MAGIFISYRREDSAGWTGRLSERLKEKFGTTSIFMDIDTIQPGTDFAQALRSAVGSCDVLLAMIGPNWPIATNPEGQRRLEDPNDWVRTELTTALNRSIPVIPVLVGGADLPKVETLPDDLKKLFQYQTHELTDRRWEYDSSQLELVLEKVLGGGKPKRNVKQTLLAYRGALVAFAIVGIGLTVVLVSPVARWSAPGTGNAQTNDGGIVTEKSVASLPSPEPTAEPSPTESASPVPAATAAESPPVPQPSTSTEPETVKVVTSARTEDSKGRSLPAGIEVKFKAGDVVSRLTSLRLEDQTEDKLLLNVGIFIRNSGESWIDVFYGERYRLLIDDTRVPPTKMSEHVRLQSDTETSGTVTFVVPKAARRVGLHISYSENDYTTIPIDLKSGVSRTDAQPPGIPRSLSKPARIVDVYEGTGTYDFLSVTLEPYNAESFMLKMSIRITANDRWFDFVGNSWRLTRDNLSYEPVKSTYRRISAHTFGDANVAFTVPKSADQVILRVPDTHKTWRNIPINLKGNHS